MTLSEQLEWRKILKACARRTAEQRLTDEQHWRKMLAGCMLRQAASDIEKLAKKLFYQRDRVLLYKEFELEVSQVLKDLSKKIDGMI